METRKNFLKLLELIRLRQLNYQLKKERVMVNKTETKSLED